jgi:predicted P-loop ATPase
LANAIVVFLHAPDFACKIGFDLRLRQIVSRGATPAGQAGPWGDEHTTKARNWMQLNGIPVPQNDVEAALAAVAGDHGFDPLADELLALEWDGCKRLDDWLVTYCSAAKTEATTLFGSRFLIGAIARALRPGCRMDTMLVLEGEQGVGKSTLVKILGGDYVGESLPDFHSRDAMQIVGSKWMVEVSELSALRKSQIEDIKGFVSRTEDTYVPKYARHSVTVPRGSVLVGNVNPNGVGYLQDSTGNRRFWPVKVGKIDIARLRRDRDQLLAEAVHRYLRGDPWWVETAAEASLFATEQEARESDIPLLTVIADWLEEGGGKNRDKISMAELGAQALQLQPKDLSRAIATEVGVCLKKLKWERTRPMVNGVRQYVYRRPSHGTR